jgi:GNAT superfamily N-acetyltransferase
MSPRTLAPSPSLHHLARRSAHADLDTMAAVLSAAFQDDPVFAWMLPGDARRRAILPAVMRLFAARFQPHGRNHVTETGSGAAVWSPPGAPSAPADERFQAELAVLVGDDIARTRELTELVGDARPPDPHHYLMLLGVAPDHRGTGVGSALLHAVLDRADRDCEHAYLEATSPRRRALYERHGFEVTRELRVSDCPPLWAMWRDPRSAWSPGARGRSLSALS